MKTKPQTQAVGPQSELARLKVLWRDQLTETERDSWRALWAGDTSPADSRELLHLETGIQLTDDEQITRFRKWDAEEVSRQAEAERMAADEKFFSEHFGSALTKEQVRDMVLAAAYRRSLLTGDFAESRATLKLDLEQETAQLRAASEQTKLELKREAEARMQAQFKLSREKFEFDAAEACLKALPALRAIAGDPTLTMTDKIQAIRQKLFAVLPA
jgi:hypothetical protein